MHPLPSIALLICCMSHAATQRLHTVVKCTAIRPPIIAAVLLWSVVEFTQEDPGWPRKLEQSSGSAIVYAPQVDDWQNFTTLTWRQAFQLTPKGQKMVVGAATFEATTDVDSVSHQVHVHDIRTTNT